MAFGEGDVLVQIHSYIFDAGDEIEFCWRPTWDIEETFPSI